VFLRELLSNASDALEKQRFKNLADEGLSIRVTVSDTKKQVVIEDNGVGMSKEELIENLGTIAKSGSKEFVDALQKDGSKGTPENIIGQFGVGFYSSFIVADYVEVVSKVSGSSTAYIWSSDGSGTYEIAETSDPGFERGTTTPLVLTVYHLILSKLYGVAINEK
jgi:HSP90 family molecular chaperone